MYVFVFFTMYIKYIMYHIIVHHVYPTHVYVSLFVHHCVRFTARLLAKRRGPAGPAGSEAHNSLEHLAKVAKPAPESHKSISATEKWMIHDDS